MNTNTTAVWPGWKTVRLIGRGSYGAVYEIERELFGRVERAALKHISVPQSPSDAEELFNDGYDEQSVAATFEAHLKSIVDEYSLMRQLNGCSNVVNCDDVRFEKRDDGISWDILIKMELLTPLPKTLPDPIPEQTVLRLARDMCQALVLCKRFDIVHRDIKPQNIFLSPLGDYKLGDFGIAKSVEKTMGGTKIGTYKYMAPEVYNNQPYGCGADIYSLDLVLYWMLNRKRMPFIPLPPARPGAGLEEQSRSRRLSGEPLPPPADGSEELKAIVLKACAFDPGERYHTAEEMLDDLNALELRRRFEQRAAVPEPAVEKTVPVSAPAEDEATAGPGPVRPLRKSAPVSAPTEDEATAGPGPVRPLRKSAPVSVPAEDEATARPAPARPARVSAPPAPEDEDRTVGVFRVAPAASRLESEAPAQPKPSAAIPTPPEPEDRTVGVFHHLKPHNPIQTPPPEQPTAPETPPPAPADSRNPLRVWICECGYRNTAADYCRSCWRPAPAFPSYVPESEAESPDQDSGALRPWVCTCGYRNISRDFCHNCWKPAPSFITFQDN